MSHDLTWVLDDIAQRMGWEDFEAMQADDRGANHLCHDGERRWHSGARYARVLVEVLRHEIS